ncbi:hypothetical protein BGE01nite_20350 [Brevifollis gellanilyticus]|uniref:Uncharacterized protein n=1 Tax=Brevifollis gellanilyticus TaxID=748831 RepID=A0A512M7P1_9BACT|nr:hypothetical protein BGE01nite_20350 [Brevifollis gellanilyticus]
MRIAQADQGWNLHVLVLALGVLIATFDLLGAVLRLRLRHVLILRMPGRISRELHERHGQQPKKQAEDEDLDGGETAHWLQ